MRYFVAILLMLCLLGGCAAVPEDTTPQSTPMQQVEPTDPSVPEVDYPVPPETQPPTGPDSTGPAPEIGPEGLPTPAL